MKSIIIIKSNDLSKGNHILLSKAEIKNVKINTLSYDSMSKEPLNEVYNEYYSENRKDTIRYEAEPEIIITGKIFNYSNFEIQKEKEERELGKQLKKYLETKFGETINLKEKENLMRENILALNRENIHEIINWEYENEFSKEVDYRDVIIEITPTEGDSIILYLDDMYIYSYIETLNVKEGFGNYEVILRKNPIIKENIEVAQRGGKNL
ncbi:MAG: hypothetical protein ACLVH9_04755 [Fusobacterium sp.]|uniref:hypothetical protein n=1 Tax=Fusobacterium sp. TaxID=68766 RepID=UPI00399AF92C